jgi:hypothetical protein
MNIIRPHVTLGHAKLCAHDVTVSIDQLAERARDLERRIERQLALDVPGIHQPFDLVGIVHACTHRHDAPHAVPVERRQLQPAPIPEVDERIVEPDVCDHDISPCLGANLPGESMLRMWCRRQGQQSAADIRLHRS